MIRLGKSFILGDSYSTFSEYIPSNCGTWYTEGGHEFTDVKNVEQTWWWQLFQDSEAELLMNNSSSGTTICNTGYDGRDCSSESFIARMKQLIENGYFQNNCIDTFFVFGGTNDSWAEAPIGELKYKDWTSKDLYFVLPAFCYLLNIIQTHCANAVIYVVINTELKNCISEGFQQACRFFKIPCILLKDISKQNGHPDCLGMRQIKEQIIEGLNR